MTFKKLFLLSSPLGQKRLLWRRPGANYPRARQSPSSPQESHPDPLWNSFHPGAFYQKETIFQQAGPLLGYRPVIGLHSASFLHLAPYQADGESLEGFHLPAAFGKWLPKPLSNLLPPGIRPPAQKLRGSSWPWFFLSQPPFPSVTPPPRPPPLPQDFLPPYLASTLVLFSLFFSLLSMHFSPLDLLAPCSVPIFFLCLFLSCASQSFWTFVSVQSTAHHYSSFSPKGVPWRERSTTVSTRMTVLFSYQTLLVTFI